MTWKELMGIPGTGRLQGIPDWVLFVMHKSWVWNRASMPADSSAPSGPREEWTVHFFGHTLSLRPINHQIEGKSFAVAMSSPLEMPAINAAIRTLDSEVRKRYK